MAVIEAYERPRSAEGKEASKTTRIRIDWTMADLGLRQGMTSGQRSFGQKDPKTSKIEVPVQLSYRH
ncbi:hypothetical protein AJ78_06644 [Emergomyces pasteurianus Ep9510]|uniref:Uncharacterized protein n=1 Tax=Emergomyces pasteurianus Ep9510 TaxID=1447872 RepID=A0A1J9QCD3_9EURO|nr:hypothetical protein AJ78_06644 [Emergomyces pasteurianus Ep9510]